MGKGKDNTMSLQRIAKEFKSVRKTLAEDSSYNHILKLEPKDTGNMYHWIADISGPPETPYASAVFSLDVELPMQYPLEPPRVKFLPGPRNNICHCNVDFKTGEICLDILTREHWSPVWDLVHVIHAIWILLGEPVPESPLNVDIANVLKAGDLEAYEGLIKYYIGMNDV